MKKHALSLVVMFLLVGTFVVSAREITVPKTVAALVATDPATEVNTIVLTGDSASPVPAVTLIPASPTPSRIEFPVQNANLEVKVVGVEKPHQVFLGTDTIYSPGPGNMFLGLGIRVRNFTGSDIPIKWSDIFLVNKYQDKWYPVWGVYKPSNIVIDPLAIEILEFDQVHPEIVPDAHFYLSDNGYVRVIFQLPEDNLYYFFGLADLPLVEIDWRYE